MAEDVLDTVGENGLDIRTEFALNIWKMFGENPMYKELSQPTFDYINYFLSLLPEEMKGLSFFEVREHLCNQLVLSFIRDSLLKRIDGKEEVEAKFYRLALKAVEIQESSLPKIFLNTGKSGKLGEFGAEQRRKIKTIAVKVDFEDEPEVIDGDYEIEDGEEDGND